jgi:hypothetical protein
MYGYSEGFYIRLELVPPAVTKTNLNDGGFHITTAANVDTLEKTNKVIGLTATPIKNPLCGNTKYPIMYGYSEGFYIRLELVPPAVLPSGFDINTISGITSGFKSRGYES